MAASSADDHLTVGGDANVVVGADPEHAAGPSLRDPDHKIVDSCTQWMPLSVPVNNPMVRIVRAGPSSMLHVGQR